MTDKNLKEHIFLSKEQYEILSKQGYLDIGGQTIKYSPTDTVYMIANNNLQEMIALSKEQFIELSTNGQIIKDGKTLYYTPRDVVYIVPDEVELDLINGYYTKRQMDAKLENLDTMSSPFNFVDELPATGQENVVYLLSVENEDKYQKYIFANGVWVDKGQMSINLGNCYTKASVDSLLEEKVNIQRGKGLSSNDFTDEEKEQIKDNTLKIKELVDNKINKDELYEKINTKADKTEIPKKLSAFTNDAGLITNEVSDLVNYYRKKDTYTKEEALDLIANTSNTKVVDELPEKGFSNLFYLMPKNEEKTSYRMYRYIDNSWVNLGGTDVNLFEYVKKDYLNTILENKVDKVDGKTLSSNDFTNEHKSKIEENESNIASLEGNKADKTEIPTKTSELENDSNFIDNSVEDLANYYLKGETYTKQEIIDLIAKIKTIQLKPVEELPETGEPNIIYLLAMGNSEEEDNQYEEYIFVDDAWEKLGKKKVDLSNHYDKAEVDTLLKNKADKEEIPTKNSELENDSEYVTMDEVVDKIYPVGCTYLSMNDVNPSTTIGGEWQLINGSKYLRCGDVSSPASGGSNSIKIEEANLPSHSHTFAGSKQTITSSTADAHTHTINSLKNSPAYSYLQVLYENYYSSPSPDYLVKADNLYMYQNSNNNQPLAQKGSSNRLTQSTLPTGSGGSHSHTIEITPTGANGDTGGDQPIKIEPEYLTIYLWLRIA